MPFPEVKRALKALRQIENEEVAKEAEKILFYFLELYKIYRVISEMER